MKGFLYCLFPLTCCSSSTDGKLHAQDSGDHEDASVQSTPSKEKAASSSEGPLTPTKNPRTYTRIWKHLLHCAYTVCHKGWSASVFAEMMSFARFAGGSVPDCHDSSSVLTECRGIIFSVMQDELKARFLEAEAFGISLDESRHGSHASNCFILLLPLVFPCCFMSPAVQNHPAMCFRKNFSGAGKFFFIHVRANWKKNFADTEKFFCIPEEKDALLTLSITVLSGNNRYTMPLAYRALPGLQAEDIMQLLKPLFTEYHLDTSKLLTFTADGASVNGVRRCQTNEHGKNIVALLRRHVGHRILAVHCAAHRLQLCAGDAFTAEYLKDLEKRVSSLYNFSASIPAPRSTWLSGQM